MNKLMLGFTTVQTHEHARKLAEGLIREKLAACVQMNDIVSWFEWEGQINSDPEVRLVIKFPAANEKAIQQWINEHHPYDVPQWIVIQAETCHPDYADWVNKVTATKG